MFGLIYHKIQSGGMTGARFNEFLENTNEHLDENETHYLIFDGAPAHRRAAPPAENTQVKVLPPYSPFLNPVEQAISCSRIRLMTEMQHEMLKFPWGNIASVFWSQLLRGTCVALLSKSVLPGSD